MSDVRAYLRLHLAKGVGPITFARMVESFGGIEQALGAPASQLRHVPGIGQVKAEQIARSRDEVDVDDELRLAASLGVDIITFDDDRYPLALKNIPSCPPLLYVRGTLDRADALSLAIVGTRRASQYGREQSHRFGALAGGAGMTVVSGLARGIDAAAHQGALSVGGRNIAVQGCGLSEVYPPEHAELAEKIVENGALISEYPLRIPPESGNFPARNRIIAGLALGTLVVESAMRGGALITAGLALEFNREVFAIPGPIDRTASQGTNTLIRDNAARLVLSFEDILEGLGHTGEAVKESSPDLFSQADQGRPAGADLPGVREKIVAGLDDDQQRVYTALQSGDATLNELCEQVSLAAGKVASAVTMLQLKGLVKVLAGQRYTAA